MTTRILHIPNFYPPHIGGIEDVCHSIVSATPGYNHEVVCYHHEHESLQEVYEGVNVTRCGTTKKLFSQAISFSLYTELKKIFSLRCPDIVHFHTPNPLAGVYLENLLPARVHLIVHWHSDIIEQKFLHFFYQPMENWLLRRADKIVVTSPLYAPASKILLPWKNKIRVIPNTINTGKLDKKEDDEEAILKIRSQYEGKKIIFAFGRHVPYKGFKYMVEANSHLKENAVMVIAGTGPLSKELKNMPSAARIDFPGRLSDNMLRHYLYASDIFAFPSITRNEAFGIALAEAMYCGLPSVTFTIPGSGVNWVSPHQKTGLEVKNRDSQALAHAINLLLNDNSLRIRLGENASKRANELYTTNSIRKDLEEVYQSI